MLFVHRGEGNLRLDICCPVLGVETEGMVQKLSSITWTTTQRLLSTATQRWHVGQSMNSLGAYMAALVNQFPRYTISGEKEWSDQNLLSLGSMDPCIQRSRHPHMLTTLIKQSENCLGAHDSEIRVPLVCALFHANPIKR